MTTTTPLARQMAELLGRLDGGGTAELRGVVERLCVALREGHVCLPVAELGAAAESLRGSRVVGGAGDFTPLVLDAEGLYLRRYWGYEQGLATAIRERAVGEEAVRSGAEAVQVEERGEQSGDAQVAASLERYFPKAVAGDRQRLAVERILRSRFGLITGGPGTGKTYTATIALALLAEQALAGGRIPRLALAAPTGKAAARLSESLRGTLARLDVPAEVAGALPKDASTLHRLLGLPPEGGEPRYGPRASLPFDVVVVDEASMVDLPMMARLFAALRADTRLLLLGDKDQLASVEAGHVLGDICAAAEANPEGALAGCVTQLDVGHRFGAGSGIGTFAQLIHAGDVEGALEFLRGFGTADFVAYERSEPRALAERAAKQFAPALGAESAAAALAALGDYRVLSPVRAGSDGVEALNALIEDALAGMHAATPGAAFYAGRPVLVQRNDYGLRLFNGDLGIVWPDVSDGGALKAYFPDEHGVRALGPARLPEHETAFAMTVHKAQGSEFARVLIGLPAGGESPILSRELLYTAVTRAREQVELWWNEAALRAALGRRVVRWSGLRGRLVGELGEPQMGADKRR